MGMFKNLALKTGLVVEDDGGAPEAPTPAQVPLPPPMGATPPGMAPGTGALDGLKALKQFQAAVTAMSFLPEDQRVRAAVESLRLVNLTLENVQHDVDQGHGILQGEEQGFADAVAKKTAVLKASTESATKLIETDIQAQQTEIQSLEATISQRKKDIAALEAQRQGKAEEFARSLQQLADVKKTFDENLAGMRAKLDVTGTAIATYLGKANGGSK